MDPRTLQHGDPAPEFTAQSSAGEIRLRDLRGKIVVLYFYPKDNTSGCTVEACGFRDSNDVLRDLGAVVLGVSKDSLTSHGNFQAKYTLNFPLLSDPDQELIGAYDVLREKHNYGRTYLGVERSTFVIDRLGRLHRIWRKVKVKGHVDEVLEAVRELQESA